MEKNWTKIFASTDNFKVDLIASLLEQKGIRTVTISTKDSSYLMFGTIELFVKDKNVKQSKEIIEIYNERNI